MLSKPKIMAKAKKILILNANIQYFVFLIVKKTKKKKLFFLLFAGFVVKEKVIYVN
jgi:hypothetical protein